MSAKIMLNDRDLVALHVGRILQSCSTVEHALFRMIEARKDVNAFATIQRSKVPALRNLISKIAIILANDIGSKPTKFKNAKNLKETLESFDSAAAKRSDFAHSEFLLACEIENAKVAILSNEGIDGLVCGGRVVQIIPLTELAEIDRNTHRLANSLKQMIQNQIDINL